MQDIGDKVKKFMKKHKVKYTKGPIGEVEISEDFLPPPRELVLREETTKITLSLTKSSVEFFKHEAEKHNTHYQKMIRTLIDQYASHYTPTIKKHRSL